MIPLIERRSALLMADVYPVRSAAGSCRRVRARPSARVVTDLVIVAYGSALGLLGALLRALMAAAKLSALDRVLGGVFGFARAVLVFGVVVLLASATPAPKAGWWQQSMLLPWLEAGVAFASPLLPESLTRLRGRGQG